MITAAAAPQLELFVYCVSVALVLKVIKMELIPGGYIVSRLKDDMSTRVNLPMRNRHGSYEALMRGIPH